MVKKLVTPALLAAVLLSCLCLVDLQFQNHLLPRASYQNIPIGGMSKQRAVEKVQKELQPPLQTNKIIKVTSDNALWTATADSLGWHENPEESIGRALAAHSALSPQKRLVAIIASLAKDTTIPTNYSFKESHVVSFATNIEKEFLVEEQEAELALENQGGSRVVVVKNGSDGKSVDTTLLVKNILELPKQLGDKQETTITLPAITTKQQLSKEELESFKKIGQKILGKNLVLEGLDKKTVLDDAQLLRLLSFYNQISSKRVATVVETVATTHQQPPQDAIFLYDPKTLKVETFVPEKPGVVLDKEKTTTLIKEQLLFLLEANSPEENTATTALPIKLEIPQKTLAQTNNLGIKEVIGFGKSEYAHSIPTRIHNVSHTAEKINNNIVPPGKEFSFNQALGEVSAQTGFKPAYVILKGKTELGDGGGVCQVSTTLFRALLDGGLKITKRLPHSYRVSYYELNSEPGFDATVYAGEVDLRFINDTNHHILIQTKADSKNTTMWVALYGTSDGRTTQIENYKKWGATPALPPEYFYDPTLGAEAVKQIDWAVGGIKTSFTNVIKDAQGTTIREDLYTSNYRPWSAKYLVGTPR